MVLPLSIHPTAICSKDPPHWRHEHPPFTSRTFQKQTIFSYSYRTAVQTVELSPEATQRHPNTLFHRNGNKAFHFCSAPCQKQHLQREPETRSNHSDSRKQERRNQWQNLCDFGFLTILQKTFQMTRNNHFQLSHKFGSDKSLVTASTQIYHRLDPTKQAEKQLTACYIFIHLCPGSPKSSRLNGLQYNFV